MKPEKEFEKDLKKIAPLFGCLYLKIPDTKMLNANNRYRNREEKRPFDAVLVTPAGNFCIECKVNYNGLKPHQKTTQDKINSINNSFFVFRKIFRKKGIVYRIEQPEKNVIFEMGKIEDLIDFFN